MRRKALPFTLLAVLVVYIYGRCLGHAFVLLDDDIHLYQNALFFPLSWAKLAAIWKSPFQGLYIPATYTLWAFVARLFGMSAAAFHATNLLLHFLNAGLVFLLLRTLVAGSVGPLAGAMLFAVHPLQVEAVAWATGTRDLLAAFFGLLALWQYLAARRWWVATGFFVLALLAKPSAAVVPLMALVLETLVRKRPWREAAAPLVPWLALSGAVLLLTQNAQAQLSLVTVPRWWERPFIAADAFFFYLAKTLLPAGLCPDYSRTPGFVLTRTPWFLPALALPALAYLIRRRLPRAGALLVLFAAGIAPVLGLVCFSFQSYSTVADRFVYFSLLAPALGFAWIAPRLRPAAIAAPVFLLAFLSHAQVETWRDSAALFGHTLRVNPDSYLAHNNLGALLEKAGRRQEASFHYRESVRLLPRGAAGHYNVGRMLASEGKYDDAIREMNEAIALNPSVAESHLALGKLYERTQRRDLAREEYRKAGTIPPHATN